MSLSRRPYIWQYSTRSEKRWDKLYYPVYKEQGKTIVDPTGFRRRMDAETRGMQLQDEAKCRAKEITAAIKAELIALEQVVADETQ